MRCGQLQQAAEPHTEVRSTWMPVPETTALHMDTKWSQPEGERPSTAGPRLARCASVQAHCDAAETDVRHSPRCDEMSHDRSTLTDGCQRQAPDRVLAIDLRVGGHR